MQQRFPFPSAIFYGMLSLILAATASHAATTIYVDDSNTSATKDGTTLHPFASVQAALDVAASGDTVRVAQGTYTENVIINAKQIALSGGYAGGLTADYTSGTGGDFNTHDPTAYVTHIQAADHATATILLEYTESSGCVIDGFTISGGHHGIEFDEAVTFPHIGNVTISHNILENNGVGEYEEVGGGLDLNGDGHLIEDNVMRNNISGRGAGASFFGDSITFTRNLVEDNTGYADHAGGVYEGGTASITENIFRGNRIGEVIGYGWGGGMLILGNATLSHNLYTGNYAPGVGGALFVDDGATAMLDHELMYGNSAHTGGAVYVDGYGDAVGSNVTISQSTITGNFGDQGTDGNAVSVTLNSTVTLLNVIAWNNDGDDFSNDDTSTITATYTLSQEGIPGTGNVMTDPLFANAAAFDFHLRSTAGRFDPAANAGAGGFVTDAMDSPAIDAGDPVSAFSAEPSPNGGRVNLGVYGNTSEASKSPSAGEGEGEGMPDHPLNLDTDANGKISLTELLRIIQFYNLGGLHCAEVPTDTEDGFVPGPGLNHTCTPYDSDYNFQDWVISLSEVLRAIQFYNSGGYHYCPASGTEDGYCPGV